MRADLVITGDRRDADGREAGAELWRVPFAGWGAVHELRAPTWCVPRRYVVVDLERGLVRAAGYTRSPTLYAGEPFRVQVEAPAVP